PARAPRTAHHGSCPPALHAALPICGLRKPSAEVLQQIAAALRVSTPLMYLRAGLLDAKEGHGVLAAIAADPDLTVSQKQSLTQIDRKSTRLNSSHVKTSYAVFCLNK